MKLKRMFDVVVVGSAAIVWLPVVAVAGLAVLLFSGRPIFYNSRRWVRADLHISMLKLRVMVPNADQTPDLLAEDAFLNTVPGSSLYTGIGRILDRLGLNEIPQFFHVIQGHMSVVGPRPLTNAVRDALIEEHGHIDDRWSSTPAGLTGPPQLVGRTALTDQQRLDLEAAYARMVQHDYRLRTDFKILLYTVLITFGLKKPLTPEAAHALVQCRSTEVRQLRSRSYSRATASDADAVA